jgi:hypothetical protein
VSGTLGACLCLALWLAPAQSADGTWNSLPIVGAPSALTSYAAIYDPVNHRKVVFGGSTCTNLCWTSNVSVLDLGTCTWSEASPSGSLPPERFIPSAIYDPVRQRMVIYGGTNIIFTFLNDVWALSLPPGGAMAWTQLATTGAPAPARVEAAAIYDPLRDRLLLVGGTFPGGQQTNEVWALDFATSTWALLGTSGTPPAPGVFMAGGYDASADRVVVHGTSGAWQLALAGTPTWTQLPTGPGPAQGVLDPIGRRLLVNAAPGLWALSLVGPPTWQTLTIAGTPPAEFDRPVYDPVGQRVIGERNHNPRFGIPHETWSVDLDYGTTSVQAALVHSSARVDRVQVVWRIAGDVALATVERRTPGTLWSVVGSIAADGSGQFRFEDLDVTAGARYAYRLSHRGGNGTETTPEVWIDVPTRLDFGLDAPRPNPSAGDLVSSFTLLDGAPARLEVFELGGRRVLSREVGTRGGGMHRVNLTAGTRLAPGVYIVVLSQAGRRAAQRVVLAR